MRSIMIPNTDLEPSVLSLGSAEFGGMISREIAFQLLDAYLAQGGTFIDTAKVYNNWIPGESSRSEKLIGDWLQQRGARSKVVLATKGAHPELHSMNVPRMSPEEITADLEASLRHLQTDCIDLYWLHRDDPARPVAEILETLQQLSKTGKLRYAGCSNWSFERIREAQAYAAEHQIPGFAAVQNLWNLAAINAQAIADPTLVVMGADLWRYQRETKLAAIPFTSQAGGLFQKIATEGYDSLKPNLRAMYLNALTKQRAQRVQELAQQTNLSITQIVLGYLLAQPFPTLPVIGPRSLAQLEDSLTATEVQLTPEQIAFLEVEPYS